ncbi:YhdP family protein [Candidatus Vallotia cooleyia]|uniref:YhdP family protein n=1 Tax=Candidatus Vallotiella adelgis TaxID=1177211 RepID=UPI001D00479C|nr:YhdP family protein [Candidatus Vallotia cooleyia]UDG82161.1 hypothetical protein GJV44_00406 [Candidatus Vallotia cooleyia]
MPDRQEILDPNDVRNAKTGGGRLCWLSKQVLRRVLAFCATITITLYFGIAATYISLRYVIFPQLNSMRPNIEQRISSALHAHVHIGRLTARWDGLQPTLDIDQLTIINLDSQRILAVPAASATLSWRSLVHLTPVLSRLIVEQPEIFAKRHPDGTYTFAGIRVDPRQHSNGTFLRWLIMQRIILLRNGVLHWANSQPGVPPLTLRGIRVAIDNHNSSHQLSLQVQPDGRLLHGPVFLRAQFHHSLLKPPTNPVGWTGTIFVSSSNIALPELARYTDVHLGSKGGTLDATAWFSFSDGQWSGARGALSGSGVRLQIDPTLPQLDIPRIELTWSLQHNDMHNFDYTLDLKNLRAEFGGQSPRADGTPITQFLRIGKLKGRFRRAMLDRGQLIHINGDMLDLKLFAQFIRSLPLPHHVLHALNRFDPRGTLANYAIQVENFPPNALATDVADIEHRWLIMRYHFKAELNGVGISTQKLLPSAENICGVINANQNGGHAAIDTTNAVVTIPGVFDNPRLSFNRLAAEATWTAHPPASDAAYPAVVVKISRFIVDNEDMHASAAGNYSNPGHGRGKLDIEVIFDRLSMNRLARYLPTSVGKHIRTYLSHALTAGTSRNATIAIHGKVAEFPYTHDPQAGIFKINLPFRDGGFDPTPYPMKRMSNGKPEIWPAFDGINGLFRIDQNMLRFSIQRACYRHIAFTHLTGRIDDLSALHSNLVIDGMAKGRLADMLNYVKCNSLALPSNHLIESIQTKGDATLALQIAIPLHADKPYISMQGSVVLANNTISFISSNRLLAMPPVMQIHGKVAFTEHSMTLERTTGQFLGGDICADGWVKQDGSSSFKVSGHLLANAAQAAQPGPLAILLNRISGSAPYSVSIRTRKNKLPNISVTSDLSGLALQFPAPFTKQAGASMLFSLYLKPSSEGEQPIAGMHRLDVQLGPVNAIYLVQHSNNNKLEIVRGTIGMNKKSVLPNKGVSASINMPHFDADAWRELLDATSIQAGTILTKPMATASSLSPAACTTPFVCSPNIAGPFDLPRNIEAFIPTYVELHLDTLTLLKRRWENVVIDATQTPRTWQANIESDKVSGHVVWHAQTPRNPYGQLGARLIKLVIPDSYKKTLVSCAPEDLVRHAPAIDIIVNDFTVFGHNFGKLEVNSRTIEEKGEPAWKLDKFNVVNPAAKLSATANWKTTRHSHGRDDNLQRTVLNFKLDIANSGALLDRLGLADTLKGGSGQLSGNISWRDRPMCIDYPTLSGNLSLKLSHGQILKINPGAARLLGLLSFQSLSRVAILDWGILFGQGLPFYNLSSTTTIRNGIAKTNDFTLNSASAKVMLQGSADFWRKQQNLLVTVTPSLNVDTIALATAVINPILGLGVFVAGLVWSEPISQSFARHYMVTGSWLHPQIKQLPADRSKI